MWDFTSIGEGNDRKTSASEDTSPEGSGLWNPTSVGYIGLKTSFNFKKLEKKSKNF